MTVARADRTALMETLRQRHPLITYEALAVARRGAVLKVSFYFKLAPDIAFRPEVEVSGLGSALATVSEALLVRLLFPIGLVELLSYWKAACCPRIAIRVGALDAWQRHWFQELLFAGMGEYFFVNGIDFRPPGFVRIELNNSDAGAAVTPGWAETGGSAGVAPVRAHGMYALPVAGWREGECPEESLLVGRAVGESGGTAPLGPGRQQASHADVRAEKPPHGSILLLSGGKDSSLAVQLLREVGEDFRCLLLNPTPAALAVHAAAGCGVPITVKRTIDPRLLALNAQGYLNGHTPFSALLAFWGVACAAITGRGKVIVANERSADEGNITFLGRTINHQYTKSFAFETSFRRYVARCLTSDISYFSLLRPLYDLQISRMFVRYPAYFDAFKSCNRCQRENSWCGRCPKCLSTFIGLYPFVTAEEIRRIFGRDLYADEALVPVVRDLVGLGAHKPFECVGTRDEMVVGLWLAAQSLRGRGEALPPLLRYAATEVFPAFAGLPGRAETLLSAWSDDHFLPPRYVALLRERLAVTS